MKIQFCSDLHLEMHQNQKWVKENPLIPNGDILIIAGDTDYLRSDFGKQDFFKKISDDFEQSYIIPGNHEYYGGFDISTAFEKTNENIFDNVTLLNNDVVSYNEVQLIFSTMWSLIGRFKHEIVNAVADFRMINYKGEPLSVEHFNQLHKKSFEFIQKEANKVGQKIIITHHLPSDLCNAEEFRGSIYNDAFCVDKTDFIKHSNIDYWIYGHSHRNVGDIEISGTKMITNQLGYIAHGEQFAFERDRVIEI